MAIDTDMSTNKIASTTSQSAKPVESWAPSSAGLYSPKDFSVNENAFDHQMNLGKMNLDNSGSSGSLFAPLQRLDVDKEKSQRNAMKVAKKKMPSTNEVMKVVIDQTNLKLNINITTKLVGQATKALTSLTSQQ